ncbi:hypothetical protein CfE428DRAFT_2052 [Chthoniobacter flavus Ellin428]|uniref:Uncharacterized protein n=1 Tax=Chthoniobacter flavus Ellin428 TaxID=497964 RepID=B4CZG4_9BACT|nr:hypothetical protein [Chthoniobacter flavus]EDY20128.1 hypothetical protein CfE428DRAFT_2052 [Chthoniobacter flavus Ellin428]
MSDNDAGWEAKGGRVTVECQSLLALATPEMFQENAFRITGLPVDATTREIARHLDKLKMMEELGQGESVHTAAFALSPPPGVDQIRDAMQCLRDPERRILDELFWFWPATFGASGKDPAIQALAGGDRNTALGIWLDREEAAATDLVATHNLAVLWQLVALEWEDYADHEEIDAERRKKIANYWQRSFDRWERLATNDVFWESIGGRAKQLDESRLSTGFVYRVRSALPSALDKIHAELAVRYAGKNRMELAGVHAQFLRARKVDPVEKMKTAELVLAPTTARIKQQIERVRLPLPKPEEGIRISQELLGQVQRTFPLYDLLLGEGSEMRNDLSDEVVEVVNRQIVQYEKATRDFETCAQIGRLLRPLAVASHWVKLIDENIGIWVGQRLLETIRPICETTVRCTGVANAAAQIAQLDATVRKIMLEPIYREASIAAARQAQDEVALTIARCAGTYGRLTLFWDVAGRYLQDSLKWAESAEVKQQVTDLIADAHKEGGYVSWDETGHFHTGLKPRVDRSGVHRAL